MISIPSHALRSTLQSSDEKLEISELVRVVQLQDSFPCAVIYCNLGFKLENRMCRGGRRFMRCKPCLSWLQHHGHTKDIRTPDNFEFSCMRKPLFPALHCCCAWDMEA